MIWLLIVLLVLACDFPTVQAAVPNIVLCMADDQGWGDVAYNGHPKIKTPHLDDMAAHGLRFDRFYAAAPVCSPTRGSVLTGRHPNRFGCFSWGRSLRPQEITVAEVLQKGGYATGHFGKWHLGSVLKGSPVNPGNSGFDRWLSAFNFYDNDPVLSREGTAVELQGESSMIAADAAIEFIQSQTQKSKPFFAVVWFGSPHAPHAAASQDAELYDGESKKDANWMGEISGLDRAIGKLRSALRELGVQDDTLFWYTSDNGGLRLQSSGGRGKKGSIYEGGLRVPAIIEWPNRIKTPRIITTPGNTSDILPTVLEITGLTIDDSRPLDGVSLAPAINGQSIQRKGMGFWAAKQRGIGTPSEKWMREELAAQRQGKDYHDPSRLRLDAAEFKASFPQGTYEGHAAWLDWPWKLHRVESNKKDQGKTVRWELYHLEDDPKEQEDLIQKEERRAAVMKTALLVWLSSVTDSLNGKDYGDR